MKTAQTVNDTITDNGRAPEGSGGKQQISKRQMVFLFAAFLLGGQHIFAPVEKTLYHNQWMATLGAAVIGLILFICYFGVIKLFPERNFSQILTSVFGKFLGKVFSLIYAVLFIASTSFSLLLLTTFWIDLDMWYTPQIVIMAFVLFVAMLGFRQGVEVLARVCIVIVGFVAFIAALDTIFITSEMHFSYLLPLKELDGQEWLRIVKYTILLEYFNLLMLLVPGAHMVKGKQGKKTVKIGVISVFIYLVLIDIRSALVLGPSIYLYDYPNSHVLKVINVVEVVPQIELIGIMFLIAIGLLRFVYMFYVSLEMFNQTMAIKNKNLLILPMAGIILGLAFCFLGFAEGIDKQLNWYFSWVGIPFYLVVPVILLGVGVYKKRKNKNI